MLAPMKKTFFSQSKHDKMSMLEERYECLRLRRKDTEVLVDAIMFNCFQSVEIKASGGTFSDNYY